MEKYSRTGQVTDENMTHTHCMLDTYDYKYTHSEYVIVIAFQLDFTNASRHYVTRTKFVLIFLLYPLPAAKNRTGLTSKTTVHAIVHAVIYWPVIVDATVQLRASPYSVCGKQSNSWTSSSPSGSHFPYPYVSFNHLYSFIHRTPML